MLGYQRRGRRTFALEPFYLVQHLIGGLEQQLDLTTQVVGLVARKGVGSDLQPLGAVLNLFDDLVTAGDLAVMIAASIVLSGFGVTGKR